jgi:UDP-N-acetylglucosamine transferase subunit ALG13
MNSIGMRSSNNFSCWKNKNFQIEILIEHLPAERQFKAIIVSHCSKDSILNVLKYNQRFTKISEAVEKLPRIYIILEL